MAFTATDLTNVEQAMVDIATGKRVVQVDVGGKSRQFQAVSIDKLQKLRSIIQADINAAAGTGFIHSAAFKDGS